MTQDICNSRFFDNELTELITETTTETIKLSFQTPLPLIQQLNNTINIMYTRTAKKLIIDIMCSQITIGNLQKEAETK